MIVKGAGGESRSEDLKNIPDPDLYADSFADLPRPQLRLSS